MSGAGRSGCDRRSASWWHDSGAAEKCAASRTTYAEYYERSVGDVELAKLCDFPTLKHDVPRTTWELQSMRELSHGAECEDAALHARIERILQALFCRCADERHPCVYTQGLCHMVRFVLLILPDEEQVFWKEVHGGSEGVAC